MTFLTVGVCDGCGARGPARFVHDDAETAAKDEGWMIAGFVAWCPSCRPAHTERPRGRASEEGETDDDGYGW